MSSDDHTEVDYDNDTLVLVLDTEHGDFIVAVIDGDEYYAD